PGARQSTRPPPPAHRESWPGTATTFATALGSAESTHQCRGSDPWLPRKAEPCATVSDVRSPSALRSRRSTCHYSFNGQSDDHQRQHVPPQMLAILLLARLHARFGCSDIFETR